MMSASDFSVLQRLYETMSERAKASVDESYTSQLLSKEASDVARKFGEESTELIIEATKGDKKTIVAESADVLYHLLAVWLKCGVTPAEVMAELERRQSQSGLEEKASR